MTSGRHIVWQYLMRDENNPTSFTLHMHSFLAICQMYCLLSLVQAVYIPRVILKELFRRGGGGLDF